jgi:hypothetical protein
MRGSGGLPSSTATPSASTPTTAASARSRWTSKAAADVERLKTLVRDADILIQNLRPGIVDDFGIGPDAMMAVNPRLIYCSIWAFGYQGR